ncbi:MAG: CoA transferase [Gammaproteobacteria bacterium]|jgi:formyl-CoA transferase|nr:CoA transferase [Gammaproteobacteria bacterium]MDP6615953.1 CoA transferase [Gammaproteobacteria bacterium]MDP6695008.1 CoA transferase [Gammaproteobacteria bacterium]
MTKEKLPNTGPLADLRVIEMGTLLAGPFCGQLLGDFGAEVIKVEPPNQGDPMRVWGREKAHGQSLWWPVVARNKKSVTLNLREKEGQDIAKDLIAKADFLLENFRPGTMERWNLSYEELAKINPGLIMIRVSGFGQTGPYSVRAGFGAVGESMGGLRYVCGDPSTPPSRMGISIGDSLAATFACIGALTALHYKEKTGNGQVVDSAIYEAVLNMMESLITEYDKADYIRERTGAILPNVAPSNVYPTKDDKMILIAANQDTVFKRMTEAMGQPELAENERYATHTARGAVQQELDLLISDWTRTKNAEELEDLMAENGIPSGKIYTAPDMLEDAHFKAREAIITTMHPKFGDLKMQNVAPKLSKTPGSVRRPGPELGEHNEEIYGEVLAMTAEQMADLNKRGII